MWSTMPTPLALLLLALVAARTAFADPVTTCAASADIAWATNKDGLNPCQQYQALRQQCEPDYTVPIATSASTPLDTCSVQGRSCCCNNIAFNLAMLCLNCQRGGAPGAISAPSGTYPTYLAGCTPAPVHTMDDAAQKKVCTNGPSLLRMVYDTSPDGNDGSPAGSWNYTIVKNLAQQQQWAETTDPPNTCPKVESATSEEDEDTAGPEAHEAGPGAGVIAGAVIGTLVLVSCTFFALWWFWLRHRPLNIHGPRKDFDLLPSAKGSRTTSLSSGHSQSLSHQINLYINNPYVNAANPRPRPETQTFSELTMPEPLAVPSDYNYATSYSGTPFSPVPPSVAGGWRNGAPSVIHSVGSSAPSRNGRTRGTLTASHAPSSDAGSDVPSHSEKSRMPVPALPAAPPPTYSASRS